MEHQWDDAPHLRVPVKRILRRHGYPRDKQEKATLTVLEQAEVLSEHWAGAQSTTPDPTDSGIYRTLTNHCKINYLLENWRCALAGMLICLHRVVCCQR